MPKLCCEFDQNLNCNNDRNDQVKLGTLKNCLTTWMPFKFSQKDLEKKNHRIALETGIWTANLNGIQKWERNDKNNYALAANNISSMWQYLISQRLLIYASLPYIKWVENVVIWFKSHIYAPNSLNTYVIGSAQRKWKFFGHLLLSHCAHSIQRTREMSRARREKKTATIELLILRYTFD